MKCLFCGKETSNPKYCSRTCICKSNGKSNWNRPGFRELQSELHKGSFEDKYPGRESGFKGKHHTKESKLKWKDTWKKKVDDGYVSWNKGLTKETNCSIRRMSCDEKRKVKIQNKALLDWKQNREYRISIIHDKILKFKPMTKIEQFIDKIIQECYPEFFKFTGDGKHRIGNRYPDWVNIDYKMIIEFNSTYWHSKLKTGIDETEHEHDRIEYFSLYGYKTLVIWEKELVNLKKVKERIRNFILTNLVDRNSDNQQPSFCFKKNPRTEEGSETGHNGSSKN